MKRPCVDCGKLVENKRRCPKDQRAYEQQRGSRRIKGHYDGAWRAIRDRAIREQPWCSGCRTPGTPDNPLTGDHIIPWVHGGRNEASNVAVLCRACNSAKGSRPLVPTP